MDHTFWNTMNGQHPVESFWSDRFLIDPSIPDSGPVHPSLRKKTLHHEINNGVTPFFSMEGCEGAWVPYGGKSVVKAKPPFP